MRRAKASAEEGEERRRPGERGASLVEFALLLPLLVSLVLGIFTGGVAYNRKISITSAVREGARFGASLACNATCKGTSPTTWVTQVTQRVVDASGGELTTADVCVWVGAATGGTDCQVSDPAGASGTWVVKVSAQKAATLEVGFFSRSLMLTAKTANRYERFATYGLP